MFRQVTIALSRGLYKITEDVHECDYKIFVQYICNSVAEPLHTYFSRLCHNNFNVLIVSIGFDGCIFLPQYVLDTDCKPKDELK
jgi:hypothetical protein